VTTDGQLFCEANSTLAFVSLALGFWLRRKELAARQWPQVKGKIISSRIDLVPLSHGGQACLPKIEYEFTYNQALFQTSHWRAGNFSIGNQESAEALTSRFSPGQAVSVYVNPNHPMKSVLEYGSTPMSSIPILLGLGCIALALLPPILE